MERGNLNVVQEEFNSSLAAAASSASDWGDACSLFKNFSSKAKWEYFFTRVAGNESNLSSDITLLILLNFINIEF